MCSTNTGVRRNEETVDIQRGCNPGCKSKLFEGQSEVALFSSASHMQLHIKPDFVEKTLRWIWIQWLFGALPLLTLGDGMFCHGEPGKYQ